MHHTYVANLISLNVNRKDIQERLGHGTFGQVLRCQVFPPNTNPDPPRETDDAAGYSGIGMVDRSDNVGPHESSSSSTAPSVALKIIKNKPAYFTQALVEVRILRMLNLTNKDELHIVRMLDFFVYRKHLCIVFE